jgi:thioredoxin 1
MKELTTADEIKQAITENKILVIDFFAQWCGPCKKLSPLLTKYESDTRVPTFKVDIDNVDVSTDYNIQSLPTVLFISNGKEINRVVGANPETIYCQYLVLNSSLEHVTIK